MTDMATGLDRAFEKAEATAEAASRKCPSCDEGCEGEDCLCFTIMEAIDTQRRSALHALPLAKALLMALSRDDHDWRECDQPSCLAGKDALDDWAKEEHDD
jgi:hypothetical protein